MAGGDHLSARRDAQRASALRFAVSACVGLLAAAYWFHLASQPYSEPIASDFTYHWLAGRAWLAGLSPYKTLTTGGVHNLASGYLYPFPAVLVTLPFVAWLNPIYAASVFMGLSAALLAWGITAEGFGRLASLAGIPFLWAATAGQLSILVTASVLIPGLGWLAFLKPNLALALAFYRPSRSMFIGGAIALALSLIAFPLWPMEWRHVMQSRIHQNYISPISFIGGPLLLLAALRWKRPEARLLLVMACIPQSLLFYDQLPLILVAKSRTESMMLVIAGTLGYLISTYYVAPHVTPAAARLVYGPTVLISLYLPALILVLLRPNEGKMPHPVDNNRGDQSRGASRTS